jgi:Protein of unknown function (DUF3047)
MTRGTVRGIGTIAVVLAVLVAGAVLASPRHRSYYFGGGDGPPTALVYRTTTAPLGWKTASLDAPVSRTRRGGASDGRLDVPLSDHVPWSLPAEGVPSGWSLKSFTGDADVELLRVDGRLAVRLRSERSSFAIYRDVVVDLNELPVLTWSWKVMRLPTGGDVRVAARDDQAAAVYVVFPRWPAPLTRSDVIGYVWDTSAPVDTHMASLHAANVKLIVVESGRKEVGQWRRYERDVVQDYIDLFGRKPPRAGKIALMSDSNDTRSGAEALFAGMGFLKPR